MRFALDDFDAIDGSVSHKTKYTKSKHINAFERDYLSFMTKLREMKSANKTETAAEVHTAQLSEQKEQTDSQQEMQNTETVLSNETVEEAVNAFVAEDELTHKTKRRSKKSAVEAE